MVGRKPKTAAEFSDTPVTGRRFNKPEPITKTKTKTKTSAKPKVKVTKAWLEKKVEKYGCDGLKALGWLTPKMVSPASAGWMDRLHIPPAPRSLVFFVEYKAENGKLSALQKKVADELIAHGHNVYVIYGETGVKAMLEDVYNHGTLKITNKKPCLVEYR